MQGFTKSQLLGSIVRDNAASTPPAFEHNLAATSSAAREGTTLTAHATPHTKATTYTTLIASTVNTAYGIWVAVFDVAAGITDTGQLCDIATGGAGSEVDIIQNIDFGEALLTSNGGSKIFYFPGITIPSGTRISARIQATITVDTCVLAVWLDSRIQFNVANTSWVTYGANTAASQGTSVPTATNAFGAWTQIGTTSRDHTLWTVGHDSLGDTSILTTQVLLEIGFGPNAGAVTSMGLFQISTTSGETVGGIFPPFMAFKLASGNLIWARLAGADIENRGVIIYGN